MKLKYYLRGLGIGIIVTTIILVSCFSMQKPKMTDEQIIEKAAQLGMIMPEQNSAVIAETETTEPEETEQKKRTADSCRGITAGDRNTDGSAEGTGNRNSAGVCGIGY